MIRLLKNVKALFRKPREAGTMKTEPHTSHTRKPGDTCAGSNSDGGDRVGDRDLSIKMKSAAEKSSSSSLTTRSTSSSGASGSISTITTITDSTKTADFKTRSTKSTASTSPSYDIRTFSSRSSSGSDTGSSAETPGAKDPPTTGSADIPTIPNHNDHAIRGIRGKRRKMTDVIWESPTNKANKLDRSLAAEHEKKFVERKAKPTGVWNEDIPPDTLVMYTDGFYLNQFSGVGIFVAPGHELNRSHRLCGRVEDLEHAEIIAVKIALLNVLGKDAYRNKKIIIRTDCLNVVQSIAGEAWTEHLNLKYHITLLAEQFPKGVDFQYVFSHEGDPGNELAVMLSTLATTGISQSTDGGPKQRSEDSKKRMQQSKLNVPKVIRELSHSIQGRR